MIEGQKERPRLIWELAVIQNADGRLIGACDLTCENPHEGDLGFIFSKDVLGKRLCDRGGAGDSACRL